MQISIPFTPGKKIYKQIVEQILQNIKSGVLRPGDRLPTERELAARLEVSRGTVKKAYAELAANNLIEIIQGSGSYVYSDSDSYNIEYRKMAYGLIEETIGKLEQWNFSEKEIAALFRMTLAKRDSRSLFVRIAVIDCNPETLSLFKSQLSYIPGISMSLILVDSILLDDNPSSLLMDYDLVLTTVTHYEQITQALRGGGIKVLPVDMMPSRQTIVSLSSLSGGARVGLICQSNKFSYLVFEQMALFLDQVPSIPVHFETDLKSSLRFIKGFDVILTAPGLLIADSALSGNALEAFQARGGRVIPFDYHIDRASLIHVEEHVDAILNSRHARHVNPERNVKD